MITLSTGVVIPEREIEISAIRAQGAGGQNVNKVSSAVHLRFDIRSSSLPDEYKQRLLALQDHRITQQGVIVIKGQQFRSQESNRDNAVTRLAQLIESVTSTPAPRKVTRPSRNARQRRMDQKTQRGRTKERRGKVEP